MNETTGKLFKAREFADLTGVTVRALHHYDRLGLLKPGRYSHAGYRLYCESDVARLEQIVALKFIGFSLREIKRSREPGEARRVDIAIQATIAMPHLRRSTHLDLVRPRPDVAI